MTGYLLTGSIALIGLGTAVLIVGRWRAVQGADSGSPDTRTLTPLVGSGLVILAIGAVLFGAFVATAMLTTPALSA